MPENIGNFLLPIPVEGDTPDVPRDMKALAEKIDKVLSEKLFKVRITALGLAAVTGDMVYVSAAGQTITLPPTPHSSQIIGVICGNSTSSTIIKASGVETINGDFISAANSITLTTSQHVILLGMSTGWWIISGEPKREQEYAEKAYTKAEAEAGFEVSSTRPAYVLVSPQAGGTFGGAGVTVSGKSLSVTADVQVGFIAFPGQKIKAGLAINTSFLIM